MTIDRSFHIVVTQSCAIIAVIFLIFGVQGAYAQSPGIPPDAPDATGIWSDITTPFSDFANSVKDLNESVQDTGTKIRTQALRIKITVENIIAFFRDIILWIVGVANIVNVWLIETVGVGFLEIMKFIGRVFVMVLEAIVSVLKWLIGLFR